MYIQSVVLRNFQCFAAERTVINIEPDLTAFIGANGALRRLPARRLRLFGIASDDRRCASTTSTRPAGETGEAESRQLTIAAFPELEDNDAEGTVPESPA